MFFYIVLGCWLLYVAFIFPILTNIQISKLKYEISKLRIQNAALTKPATVDSIEPNAVVPMTDRAQNANYSSSPLAVKKQPYIPKSTDAMQSQTKTDKPDLERQFGMKIPVWIGSISLAFAGFYMIQYSIEAGLLSPAVRLMISSLFGVILMAASFVISKRNQLANGARIAQALAGAGVGILYLSTFAATSMYHFFAPQFGFLLMAIITGLCIFWSLTHGAPIAFMGLICGFLTPALIQGEANSILLFSYLYVVLLGCFLVIRKNNWWWLADIAVVAAFIWAFAWAVLYLDVSHSIISLQLFVLALCGTYIAISNEQTPNLSKNIINALGLFLLAFITMKTNYGVYEWIMFSILTIACSVLAILNAKVFQKLLWFTIFLIMVMIYDWHTSSITDALIVTLSFGSLFTLTSYSMAWYNSENRFKWILQAATANAVFFIISYFKIKSLFINVEQFKQIWCFAAVIFSGLWAYTTWLLLKNIQTDKITREQMLTVSALATIGFSSLAGIILLDAKIFAIFFSIEFLALSWLNTKLELKSLGPTAIGILVVIAYCLFYQYLNSHSTFVNSPFLYYGVPAVCIGVASILFKGKITEQYREIMECFAIILITALGITVINNIINNHTGSITVNTKNLLQALYNNYLMLLGLACIVLVGDKYKRPACEVMGFLLLMIACIRIILLDILTISSNSLSPSVAIGSTPIFNTLLLSYALPSLWLVLGYKNINLYLKRIHPNLNIFAFALLLIFMWLSLSVRQYYHGTYLASGVTSNIETYTYSIVWLLFGITLLIVGTRLKEKQMRIASLVLLILTITKVFLYDASELTGLLRVISFLGLGVSLIAISWFYAKFVFKKD